MAGGCHAGGHSFDLFGFIKGEMKLRCFGFVCVSPAGFYSYWSCDGVCVIFLLFGICLFLHVAQWSIALGRQTLPHVGVKRRTEGRETERFCVCVFI